MSISDLFPFYPQLTQSQRDLVDRQVSRRIVFENRPFSGEGPCLFALRRGRLRAYITSGEGKEITLFRLFPGEAGLLLPSGSYPAFSFAAERDSEVWLLPPGVTSQLRALSLPAANFAAELAEIQLQRTLERMEGLLWRRINQRLAECLLEEAELDHSLLLEITHEKLAGHLGTAREVVTRTLRRFQEEGLVELGRGWLKITDEAELQAMLS